MSEEQCSESKWEGYRTYPCKRPVTGKDERGRPLCGPHLAGSRTRARAAVAREVKAQDEAARRDALQSLINELGCGAIAWEWQGEQARNIVITPQDAVSLINRLKEKE